MTDTRDTTPMFDAETDFKQNDGLGTLTIKRHQYIPDNYIDALKSDKMDSFRRPSGDMLHMCSIPVAVIENLKEFHQFDCMNERLPAIIKKLKELGLDAFITSDKQI